MNDFDEPSSSIGSSSKLFLTISRKYQALLDYSTPHLAYRWAFTAFLLLVFMFRVIYYQGFYIVTYALGIYYLNMLIAFLTPKIDPAIYDFEDEGPSLPTSANEEFRPFIRRLPEFKFCILANTVALFHHPLWYNYEKTDTAYDQVSLFALDPW
ncbi:hypothetical protein SSS_07721 [Sarcoptes scabiei]|nr:hypothetical protein SSS_07721 [Sarcoptes scabiei]